VLKVAIAALTESAHAPPLLNTVSFPVSRIRFSQGVGIVILRFSILWHAVRTFEKLLHLCVTVTISFFFPSVRRFEAPPPAVTHSAMIA